MAYAQIAMASLQLAGGYFAAQNAKETARINGEISDMNSEFADLDAYDAQIEGYSLKSRYQSVVDKTLSTQRTNLAAADVDLQYGSAAEIQKETRFTAEMNKMEIDKQAEERALGFRQQSRDYQVQGAMTRSAGSAEASAYMFQGLTSVANTYASNYREINSAFSGGATGYSGATASDNLDDWSR